MKDVISRNLNIFKILIVILISISLAQLFRIQVLEHKLWLSRAEERSRLRVTYKASRGDIYYANGEPLAVSELAYGITVFPQNFENENVKLQGITKENFAKITSEILNLDEANLLAAISREGRFNVPIANRIEPDKLEAMYKSFPYDLNLWTYEEQSRRFYPDGRVGSKISGYVRYEGGEEIGNYGVEGELNGPLRGRDGIFLGKKTDKSQLIASEEFENISPKDGIDVTLTIDRGLQTIVEERAMYWLNEYKAKEITIVVMQPNTGRILALANYPTYDPNKYWDGEISFCDYDYYILNPDCNPPPTPTASPTPTPTEIPVNFFAPENYQPDITEAPTPTPSPTPVPTDFVDERIKDFPEYAYEIFRDEDLPLVESFRNAANTSLYEPGSVTKVITLAIAYEYNKIPRDPYYELRGHNGCIEVVDATLCTAGKVARSVLTIVDMLRVSDNVGAIEVAQTVPVRNFVEIYEKFGLGRKTGVELEGEAEYRMKPKEQWTLVDQATAAYGQGSISFTPIQLTHAWNILASGGKSYKPTIVKEINDNGKVKTNEPQFIEEVVAAQTAKDALYTNSLATEESMPSTYRDFYHKYPFSGKTGTADIPKLDGLGYQESLVNTSFIGVMSAQNPKFTMLVWLREPRVSYDGYFVNATNTAQNAWIDIAGRLVIKMQIPPADLDDGTEE